MSNELHLPPDYRAQVDNILSETSPEIEVWAYGSRADGSNHDASDLDLVLRTPDLTPVSVNVISRLREAFDESNLPIIVDIHDWARLPEAYHEEIERSYYVLAQPE